MGRVEAGGDFNFGLFHQGPNGAVITYISVDPAPWPTDLTRWVFLSQGRVEAGAIFMNSGDKIYTAPGPTGLTRWLLSSSGDSCIDAGAGFKENGEIWTRRLGDQV